MAVSLYFYAELGFDPFDISEWHISLYLCQFHIVNYPSNRRRIEYIICQPCLNSQNLPQALVLWPIDAS